MLYLDNGFVVGIFAIRALVVKEELRQMYDADTMAEARCHHENFYVLAYNAVSARSAGCTVRRWGRQILPFFTTGRTNAKSEAQKPDHREALSQRPRHA